jgi:multiple sugar transport system substrate-binding protein
MRKTTRIAAALAALFAVSVFAGSCGEDDDDGGGTAELTFWHGQTDVWANCLKKQIEEFNATHPDVQVSTDAGGVVADRMLQKVTAGLQAGNYPDVAYIFGSDLANLAKGDELLDLTEATEDGSIDLEAFVPAGQEAVTVDDRVRAVPALIDNLAVVYNKKIFDQAGVAYPTDDWTWDEFKATAAKLTDEGAGIVGTGWPGTGDEDTTWRIWPLIWQLGGDVVSEDGESVGFDNEAGEQALAYVNDLAADGSVYVDTTAGAERMNQLFQSDKMAMIVTGPWNLPDFVLAKMDYGVAFLPAFENEHTTIAGPDVWAIFDNGEQRSEGAIEFVAWLTSAEQNLRCAKQSGSLPTRQDLSELEGYDEYVKSLPGLEKFVDNIDNSQVRPTVPEYPQISQALGKAIGLMLFGEAEPAEALSEAVDRANAELEVPG